MKIMGSCALPLASSCCRSSPLRPGSWTSSTRQLGASGRWRVKNSWAEANVRTLSPAERMRLRRLSRIDLSSSTTKTNELSSCITAPPGEVRPHQHQHVTRLGSRLRERRLYRLEEILLAAGLGQKVHCAGFKGSHA